MTTISKIGFKLITVVTPLFLLGWMLMQVSDMLQPVISALGGGLK